MRKTKWIPFGSYSFADNDYIVFARKNLKSGMLYFKVKKVTRSIYSSNFLPYDLIDVKEQWKIINDEKELEKLRKTGT